MHKLSYAPCFKPSVFSQKIAKGDEEMRVFSPLILLLLLFSEVGAFNIVKPYEREVKEEAIVSVVVEADLASIDSIAISNDANDTFAIKLDENRSHYCKSVTLHPGSNRVRVVGYKDGAIVKEQRRELFLTSKVDKDYRYPPQGYSKSYFHRDESEKVCSKCHDMSVNEVKGVAFEDITRSNCYECHKDINSNEHSHAPSVNWLCTSCHSGKSGELNQTEEANTKYSVPDPIEELCLSCHKKHKEEWANKRFHHEPAESGRCNRCHNPHSSPSKFYLRKPAWELCTGCHKDKIEGVHIVKTFVRKAHPTHNVKDPSREGEDLSCVSCHNPHVSNAPSLLQSESAMGLCSRCHKK